MMSGDQKKGSKMAIKLKGKWEEGYALDIHTTGSSYLGVDEYGHDQFDTKRSKIGELLYKLKYKKDITVIDEIVNEIEKHIPCLNNIDLIIPIPPSDKTRTWQPVNKICNEVSKKFNIQILDNVLIKKSGAKQIKNITDLSERKKELEKVLDLTCSDQIIGKRILLFDDLFRSGSTLNVATDLLYHKGKAASVCVLTLTKTRSKC